MGDPQPPETEQIEKSANTGTITVPGKPWLRPWQPGQSGNPSGRPKRKPLTEQLERILDEVGRDPQQRTYARRLVESAVKRAIKKDTFALKEIWERAEGKVPQAVTGGNGGPVQFAVAVMYRSADGTASSDDE